MIRGTDRELLRAVHVVADALTDGVCRATTRRAERADQFLQLRNAVVALVEGAAAEAHRSVAGSIDELRSEVAQLRRQVQP